MQRDEDVCSVAESAQESPYWIVWEHRVDKQSACLEMSQNIFEANEWLINSSLLVHNAQPCSVSCTWSNIPHSCFMPLFFYGETHVV